MSKLFQEGQPLINVGLQSFADSIVAAGGKAVQVDWTPPAGGNRAAGWSLAQLINHPAVESANEKAYAAFLAAQPVLAGVGVAREHLPGMGDRMILHAGPPIAWEEMCGPMQGAVIGAILYEGWAADADAALAAGRRRQHRIRACASSCRGGADGRGHQPVDAGMDHRERSRRAIARYSNMNEGLGKVLRFGANSPEVIKRLHWMAQVLAPALAAALAKLGPMELKPLIAQALQMGDEVHNRNAAASSLFLKKIVPAALHSGFDAAAIADAVTFIAGNDHFFLNLSMAACKSMLDAAHGVPGSSLVTAMSRNGVRFGIRLSGTGEQWFEAPSPVVGGLYFPSYGPEHAAPDMGDSSITETAGLGGFAMATAPAIVQFVGGTPQDAIANTREMRHITLGPQQRVHAAGDEFQRHARRHRCAPRARYQHHADHQHRHRAQGSRSGPDRRRHHARAAGVLHAGHHRAGVPRRRRPRPAACQARTVIEEIAMAKRDHTAVVAVGGNSLIVDDQHQSIPDQCKAAAMTSHYVADMVEAGWTVVLTHGNGPQVGFILRRSGIAKGVVPEVPVDYADADTQGAIGYMFQRALYNEFQRRKLKRKVVAIVTQVLVDPNDPAFRKSDQADRRVHDRGRGQVAGAGFRLEGEGRCRPGLAARGGLADAEGDHRARHHRGADRPGLHRHRVRRRRHSGAAGRARRSAGTRGSDRQGFRLQPCWRATSARNCSWFLPAWKRWPSTIGKPDQRWLERIMLADARRYFAEGQFPKGSMGPKIEAIIAFLEGGGDARTDHQSAQSRARALGRDRHAHRAGLRAARAAPPGEGYVAAVDASWRDIARQTAPNIT